MVVLTVAITVAITIAIAITTIIIIIPIQRHGQVLKWVDERSTIHAHAHAHARARAGTRNFTAEEVEEIP
jgi:hypothetical protein